MLPVVLECPEEAVILERFQRALAELWAFDRVLIERRLGQKTVTHRLAVYLERQFPGFHTDCEYSRNSRVDEDTYDFPSMSRPRQRDLRRNLVRQGLSEGEAEDAAHTVTHAYPDIIVHYREENHLNLLVVETRLLGDGRGWGGVLEAREKLQRYTLQGEKGLYRYAVGLLVELGVTEGGDQSIVHQFRDGQEVGRVV
ncbi:hypothetical protein DAETH_02530 [Deinococcus aetherius]|uniref:Uncharacterized protein n=1 Tax=Deinococcus aetherius TaxID=200252 RepID=A0ABN6RCD2_9DEIO|nr:hypothetical protein [Deinococcus aetherius]BDP40284.1 hypothetical protein DAETH_02530 [Deinococcus aetherius]